MAKLQISKLGRATSMEGVVVDFTSAMLTEVAATYDPKLHEAPLVIGHPKIDDPAFGWVGGLSFADGALVADEKQVDDAFNELRRKGNYKKPSASFYTPECKNNPTPGKWYLRHVGFLGAMPPALKGLNAKPVSFAEAEEGVVTFGDLPGYAGGNIASMFRRLRDYFISKEGLETADRLLPDWEVEGLREISQRASESHDLSESAMGVPGLSFSEQGNPALNHSQLEISPAMKTAEQLQTELNASQLEIKKFKDADTKRQADAVHAGNVSFADTLVADARWPAAAKDILVATLDHLSKPSDVVSFGEGDAAKPLAQVLQEQLKAMPQSVSFGEFAGKGSGGGADNSASAVADKAVAYQAEQAAKGNTINTAQAVAHVSRAA